MDMVAVCWVTVFWVTVFLGYGAPALCLLRVRKPLFPCNFRAALKHDPEKWKPVFGQDHAQTNNLVGPEARRGNKPSTPRPNERGRGTPVAAPPPATFSMSFEGLAAGAQHFEERRSTQP
jgi:hypothetical protein